MRKVLLFSLAISLLVGMGFAQGLQKQVPKNMEEVSKSLKKATTGRTTLVNPMQKNKTNQMHQSAVETQAPLSQAQETVVALPQSFDNPNGTITLPVAYPQFDKRRSGDFNVQDEQWNPGFVPAPPAKAPLTPAVLSTGFESTTGVNLPTGWVKSPTSTTSINGIWGGTANLSTQIGMAPHAGTRFAGIVTRQTTACDAWMFSPSVNLTAGSTYAISWWMVIYGAADGSDNDALDVKVSDTNTAAGMATGKTLYSTTTEVAFDWVLKTTYFTPETTGAYYVGFHCSTPAVHGWFIGIDDFSVAQVRDNDLSITPSYPYSQVPVGQTLLPVLSAQVSNIGVNQQTNVVLSVTYGENSVGSSAPLESINMGETKTLTVASSGEAISLGSNSMVYSVKQDETDNDTSDNSKTISFTGTLNTFANDNGTIATYYSGAATTYGNIYTFTKETSLFQVLTYFYTGGNVGTYTVSVFPMVDATTTADAAIYTSDPITRPTTTTWSTYTLPAQLTLQPGSYYICASTAGTVTSYILADANTDGRVGYGKSGNSLTAFAGHAFFLRLTVDLPENDLAVTAQSPFSQIPVTQPLQPTATVTNKGFDAQTNIVLTAELNGQVIGTSDPLASLDPFTSTTLSTPDASIPLGLNSLKYTVTQYESDFNPSDNTITTQNFTGTSNTFATDNGAPKSYYTTAAITLGNIYTFTKETTIFQVLSDFNTGTAGNYTVSVYPMTGATTTGATATFTSAAIAKPTAGGWLTYTLPTPLTLAAGSYFICTATTGTVTNPILVDANTDGRTGYQKSGTNLLALGGAVFLRLTVDFKANDIQAIPNGLPYAQIPLSQAANLPFPATLSAKAYNAGTAAQHNIVLSVTYDDALLGTSTTPIATLASSATSADMTVTTPDGVAFPTTLGKKDVYYTVSQDETDEMLANNTQTNTFEITNDVYAVDDCTPQTTAGVGGNSAGARVGNSFTISQTTSLKQVTVGFNALAAGAADLDYNILLYAKPTATTISATPIMTQPAVRLAAGGWFTVDVPETVMTPGDYFLCVQQVASTNIGILYDAVPGRACGYISAPTGTTLSPQASFGNVALRMITYDDPCPAITSFPWTEDFEEGTPACWTTIDKDGDGFDWFFSTFNGNGIAASYSWDPDSEDALTPDNWLITPKLVLGDNYVLSFKSGSADSYYFAEKYSVLVSTTGTNPEDFNEIYTETLTGSDMKTVMLPLSDYAGQTVHIAFRHWDCTDEFVLLLDDVTVFDNSDAVDAQVVSIDAPNTGDGLTANEPVTVTLKNNGGSAISGFNLKLELNGTEVATENYTGSIASFAQGAYTFDAKLNLSALGKYEIKVTADLDGDQVPDNNSATKTIGNFPSDPVQLYGYSIYPTVALVTFPSNNPTLTQVNNYKPGGGANSIYAAEYYDGYFYYYSVKAGATGTTPVNFVKASTSTWTDVSTTPVSALPYDMAFDYSTKVMYGTDGWDLYTINLTDGSMTDVGRYGDNYMFALACSTEGQLYGIDFYGNLCAINKTDASYTTIAFTGFDVFYVQSMSFDHNTGRLFWAMNDVNGIGKLVELDPVSGVAFDRGTMTGNAEIVGLYTPYIIDHVDMEVASITSPVSGDNLTDSEPVTVVLKNNGNVPATGFSLTLNINGTDVATETYTGTIAGGSQAEYTFTATADLSAAGEYTIKVTVAILDDEVSDNNSKTVVIDNIKTSLPEVSPGKTTVFEDAKGQIQVVSPNPLKEVAIYNLHGVLIYKESSIQGVSCTINRSLPAGAYLVKVISEKNTDNVKLLIK